ncbi:MAG: hypothetical protein Q9160_002466 [Pyrenula sp. 1 TL-2023]
MDEMFKPPVNRSMQTLDRAFFRKTIPLSAAKIYDNRNISKIRNQLWKSHDLISRGSIKSVIEDPGVPNFKCILLQPQVICNSKLGLNTRRADYLTSSGPETWSPTISTLVEQKLVSIQAYDLELAYDDWDMHDILSAIIPTEDHDEMPTGFAQVGHVAHVNLREHFLPYKHLIGQVLLDKASNLRTVINKTEDVGSNNVFRTFPYEILAGDDDMKVSTMESDCEFRFDFSKVYWNTRLNTEHTRIINKFKKGEAVCDAMAGVGPFACPAGKKDVFVWANDLNPDCYAALSEAIKRNKVDNYVKAFCGDGREFMRRSALDLPRSRRKTSKSIRSRSKNQKASQKVREETMEEPSVFAHYVMNLPASAVEFLDAFRGIYAGREELFREEKLPFIHVYCFSQKHDDPAQETEEVCQKVSTYLGSQIKPSDSEVEIHDVRLVSPQKKMFCASFRLPEEVAFAES